MPLEYRLNHYVPIWHQKRFVPVGQKEPRLYYLDLSPRVFGNSKGDRFVDKAVRLQGPKSCFAERDLYTATFGITESTEIEQRFFGAVDTLGKKAVEYFATFMHPDVNGAALTALLRYMSTQKLRTPKGLAWLAESADTPDKTRILGLMLRLQQMYSAIWTESVWSLADAAGTETKFILSDHPVTVYNRRCGPRSQWCRGNADPDVTLHGTHTIFPLSLERVLILTNLSWIRNPYRSPTQPRQNPVLFRDAMFDFRTIQVGRRLSDQEVREINFIIKSRARRFLAAGREEWLYPESTITKSDWATYGSGYLLMPDPRGVTFTGEFIWGTRDGTGGAMDAYGRRPGDPDFGREGRSLDEYKTLHRFQGEFARLFGPQRRGRAFDMVSLDPEADTEEVHRQHLSYERRYR